MPIDTEVVQRLLEVGYYAISRGQPEKAEKIFQGLSAARPESEYPVIGLAVLKMNSNQPDEAVTLLKQSPVASASPMGRGFLALALKLGGKSDQSREILAELLDGPEDDQATQLAHAIQAELK